MTDSRAADAPSPPPAAWLAWNFASTILVSAFLLFQVQPLISKFILPWFGGSPGVWTTCMVFFQVVLFCGYAYAHLTSRFLKPKAQAVLHLVLIGLALAFMPIAPNDSFKPQDANDPALRILWLLVRTVGLPYFVLSSTGPLIQAWFSHAYPGRSPYRLYALSNVGSLVALLSYPFFFEVRFSVGFQAIMWSVGFAVFGLLCGIGAVILWRLKPQTVELSATPTKESSAPDGETPAADRLPPTMLRRVLWLGLPAVGTLMLLAVTHHVTQEVAPSPFLWVIPLSLYLLSFIICFDHERWYQRLPFAVATVLLLFLLGSLYYLPDLVIPESFDFTVSYIHELIIALAALFGVCMVCHGELVKLRPSPRHLTEFYLMISAGGALGGIFVSLVAPSIFTTYFEWNIGLCVSFVIAAAVCLHATWVGLRNVGSGARAGALVPLVLVFVPGLALTAYWQIEDSSNVIYRGRNFYGPVSVSELFKDDPARHHYGFRSGAINHGRQYADPKRRREKIAYFAEHSGSGRALRHHLQKKDLRVGVIGMGIGALAAYAEHPGQYFRFYEINPEVELIARKHFTYLGDCRGKCDVIMGDARLELEREKDQNFDVIVLDAFTSDSVPVHLLTKEAFDVYLRHLRADGIIVANITNRYLDLAPVIQNVADLNGLGTTRIHTEFDKKKLIYYSEYMVLTKDQSFLSANPPTMTLKSKRQVPLWTDRYSNLFQVLMWGEEE